MLISVTRFYITSGMSAEVLLNTDYIIKVDSHVDGHINTRVIVDNRKSQEGPDVVYLKDTLNAIKTKVGLIRNKGAKRGTKRASK